MHIKITSDSTCDLTKDLLEKYNIYIFPLTVIKGGQQYLDGIEIQPQDIFDFVENGSGVTHTSAVSVGEFDQKFEEFSKAYDAVIHISLSSDLSACYQNAVLAAENYGNVYAVDSRNLSSGIGHVVLDAALMAERGMAPDDIVRSLNDLTPRIEASFVIDSLKYLHRGGRCSGVAALGANVLKLKPCIEVINGKMDVGKKYRGNFDKVILQYVEDRLKGRDDIDYRRIFVTSPPDMDQKIVDSVVAAVKENGPFAEIIETHAGCTISHHCGPVCLGILFIRK
jgi:DegV family protein with EDD domain